MAASARVSERLSVLKGRGSAELAPLWIEELAPTEALSQLADRDDPLARLQKARFLSALGEEPRAREVLHALGDLPAGLEAVRQSIRSSAPALQSGGKETAQTAVKPPMVSKTLAELYASQGDVGTAVSMYRQILGQDPGDERARGRLRALLGAEPADPLHAWLERVRLWRRALSV